MSALVSCRNAENRDVCENCTDPAVREDTLVDIKAKGRRWKADNLHFASRQKSIEPHNLTTVSSDLSRVREQASDDKTRIRSRKLATETDDASDEDQNQFRDEIQRWSRGFPKDIKDQLMDILSGESGELAEDESELIEYLMTEGYRRSKVLRPSDYVPPPDPDMRTLVYPDDMKFRAKYLDEKASDEMHKLRQLHHTSIAYKK